MALRDEIEACEHAVWQALLKGDAEADRAALDDSFLGVYPDGFAGIEAHTDQLVDGPTVAAYTLSEVQVRPLGDGLALIAYRADFQRTGRRAAEAMYVSSIWRRDGQGWRNIFSQDTPVAGPILT